MASYQDFLNEYNHKSNTKINEEILHDLARFLLEIYKPELKDKHDIFGCHVDSLKTYFKAHHDKLLTEETFSELDQLTQECLPGFDHFLTLFDAIETELHHFQSNLLKTIKESSDENDALYNENVTLKSELNTKDQQISILRSENIRLKKQNTQLNNSLDEINTDEETHPKSSSNQEALRDQQAHIQHLTEQLENERELNQEMTAKLKMVRIELNAKKRELADINDEKDLREETLKSSNSIDGPSLEAEINSSTTNVSGVTSTFFGRLPAGPNIPLQNLGSTSTSDKLTDSEIDSINTQLQRLERELKNPLSPHKRRKEVKKQFLETLLHKVQNENLSVNTALTQLKGENEGCLYQTAIKGKKSRTAAIIQNIERAHATTDDDNSPDSNINELNV